VSPVDTLLVFTAEMSRWDSNGTGKTLELEVELE